MSKYFSIFCFLLFFSFSLVHAQNHTVHRVKKGETIEGIAKRYYVTPFDIYTLNPEAKKELKPNTILIIPKSKVEVKKTIIKELQGFKTHKTKRKETLYSLAKNYNVSEDDIKKHNKFLYANPLRKGDKLQIPIFKITEVVEKVDPYKAYIVQPKEGKWRIAYKFGITVAELESLNPNMGEILKEGQEIKVPNIEDDAEKEIDDQYSYYKVLPKEGFYRLKIKLGLEQDQLEALNPELKETGLKAGMILKIPFNESISVEEEKDRITLVDSISDYTTKRIAIMLPFRLNRVDFDSIAGIKRSIKSDPYLDASLDFHSGVLMAVDSLQTLGISLKVDVYDTKNEVNEVSQIINNHNFEDVDAVIGPLTSKTFEKASSELRKYHVPIISPIGSDLKLYDNVFQSRASDELLKSKVLNFVKSDTLISNIVIVADSKHVIVSNNLKQEFIAAKQVFSRKDKEGVDKYYLNRQDIEDVLKPGNNMVFLETKDVGFASNVTSILASLIQKENEEEQIEQRDIVLVTTDFNKAFEGDEISNEHLSKLQFHYATTSKNYIENDAFAKKYESVYHITPNKRAVKGFDLTMDVVLRLVTSDDLFLSVNNAPLTEYVENKFSYKKKLFGGFYNDAVYLVKHQDLAIVEVKR
ncbi:PBP1 and LysM peptidoglycan-binding domain-containing protein [Seonamhaeicola aphaedonensis]|uniref:Amino acid/amide ABC transporter substrate-binding protein (HAAT family) n=1 Tax=Seonamhaeicola aphaedonensis TaxID=1461338 RepID=A0A3D9HG12_9FLAO|nr:LysM peptidoglycan-binding domain-containing protein [Seonamhaeicola aphaedonensis]RED48400.1 amino acid/amide ABC transporter substrate-binding protein (HAAT family) [Seonamhaeicola aphaedonensis]